MTGYRALTLLIGVLATCTMMCVSAFAGDQDSRFDISPDGARVDFDLKDAPRRDVLNRLFAATGVEIRWINASYGNERISGKFSGSASSVARDLLAQTNFVLVHDQDGGSSRVIRVLIVGPAQRQSAPEALAAIAATMPSSGERNGVPTAAPAGASVPAHGQTSARQFGRGGDSTGLRPPPPEAAPLPVIPPGAEAPRLIPPPPGTALPLIPASPGARPPPLGASQSPGVDN